MNIKTIEEAKKYLNKIIYTATDIDSNRRGIFKIKPLYIGGVNLFFNQVNYTVEGFYVYEDKECQNTWGDIKKEGIGDKFDNFERTGFRYFFSKTEAEKYKEWMQKDDLEQQKEYDIRTAKELLDKHKINYEIFEK